MLDWVGQFWVLNFQGTVYYESGFRLLLAIYGGSIFNVKPGSVLIINQYCRRFYEDAEQEGFLFGKYLPTDAGIDDIIAIHKDKALAHVGFVGRMAFHAPHSVDSGMLRIDYAKYIAGEEEFYYQETEA